ncbi:serine threonine-protein kinase BRI1-like [Seminavis robusta]|uniref:Serine threonine-protein kinase BRI1-like n=1 Tax=Seminavis robusta TaxID=568900 RepID=A0A9N8ED82_9STRA|nr:serine threonine-protein kinase BRI1-like [Seminavis robusta]|eukprot:Sro979_g227290.1 serine threonine-protein kinase BRI1-like (889) ;mRNA; f:27525-30369
MLSKEFMNFESPNAIDAGDAPPSNPNRRGRGRHSAKSSNQGGSSSTRGPRSMSDPVIQVVPNENLFRGEKIKIVDSSSGSDHSSRSGGRSASVVSSPAGSNVRYTNNNAFMNSYSEQSMLEFTEDDGSYVKHDQLPSPEDARLYAQAVLTDSFRRYSTSTTGSDEEDPIALALEEAKPLSSSAVNTWRRPSRRKSSKDIRQAAMMFKSEEDKQNARRSCIYLVLSVFCSILILGTAVAFFIIVTTASVSNAKDNNSSNSNSNNDVSTTTSTTVDGVTDEMIQSPRFLKTIEWLSEHGISDMKALTTEGSPQFLAAEWIADTDKLKEEIPVTADMSTLQGEQTETAAPHQPHADLSIVNSNYTEKEANEAHLRHEAYERFLQRYILAVFYFALSNENANFEEHWTHHLNFLTDQNECAWHKVETANDGKQYTVGVACNEKGLVQDIFIPNNNLQGAIPSEIRFLRHLELLSLRHNTISGTIPADIGHLYASLQYLDLSKNALTGSIPPNVLGRLHGLKVLGLSSNLLEGTLPMADFTSLTHLKTLDLGYNQFTGTVKKSLFDLKDLEFLYLEYNEFDDVMDSDFFIQLHKLEELTLNNNKFKSIDTLPLHLLSHPQLRLLDLSNNFLEASLPSSFLASGGSVETSLEYLNIRNNQMKGSIPLNIQELSNLELLDLSQNALTGTVPVSLGNMKDLTRLHLGENNFAAGMIPPTLFTILNLKHLSIPMSGLTGQIPTWFPMLSHLEYLDLTGNRLTGSIPSDMFAMPKLKTLLLGSNMLNSTLPPAFPQSQLEILAVDNNAVIGHAADICENAANLHTFTYGCAQVVCHGACCHSECCSPDAVQNDRSDECFGSLLSTSLQTLYEEETHSYQANRTILSFSPNLILRDHTL